MKSTFHSEDGAIKGTYEETWLSPKKWRREVRLADATLMEVQTEDAFYRTFPGKFAPRLADDVIDALSFSLPGENGTDFHEPDWATADAKLGSLAVLRLSRGYISPNGIPDVMSLLFFVQPENAFLRGRYHYSILSVFNDLQPFAGKSVARKVANLGTDGSKVEIEIDALEPVSNGSESLFVLLGVKPLYTSEDEERKFTPPHAVYTVRPSIAGWHGKARCVVKVDEHGHVRDVEVKETTDQSVIKSIRAAIMNWEYEPATMNGRTISGLAQVNVE